jgi:hypothetical protein
MIKEAVSQTTLGQTRLLFWRDAVKDIFAVSRMSVKYGDHQLSRRTNRRGIPSHLVSMKQHKRAAWHRTTFKGL